MNSAELLVDAFGRIRGAVQRAVDGLTPAQLEYRVGGQGNSIAWLVWHLSRVQDDHVAEVAQRDQVWLADGWYERFGLPFGRRVTGYGQSSDDVGLVRVASADLLVAYHNAVYEQTANYVRTLTDADLSWVVDESWDPPVTLGVRLVSVISDDLQHVGQAAFARGVLPS